MADETRSCPSCGQEMAKRIADVALGGAHYDQFTSRVIGRDAEVTYKFVCIRCTKRTCMVKGCKSRARHLRHSVVVVSGLPAFGQNTWACNEHFERIRGRIQMSLMVSLGGGLPLMFVATFSLLREFGASWWTTLSLYGLSFTVMLGPFLYGFLKPVGVKKRKYMLSIHGKVVEDDIAV